MRHLSVITKILVSIVTLILVPLFGARTAHAMQERVTLTQNAQILVTGMLENTCHKAGPARAVIDTEAQVITIIQTTYLMDSAWCLQVVMPYSSLLEVGPIPAGAYRIEIRTEEIAESTSAT